MPKKRQTITVEIDDGRVRTSWGNSRLVIDDYGVDATRPKRVIIRIQTPSDIRFIRQQLKEIETYWRTTLKGELEE